ncbi:MAG: hypothetical protein WC254_00330 [Candidatus Woesearchaeota archaeon]|jgi:hypothetical protein
MRVKIPLSQRIALKLREIPALWRAKKQEKIQIPTKKQAIKEEKQFEKEVKLMKKIILQKRK